ncbi:hypothetical protein PENSPDRAFT_757707 [Peniophora sp. CONT]|nr:hypothetical protein PENSPDRAFT_757707 [Peniophora sp. CONT]
MESDNTGNLWDQFARTMLTARQENETLSGHRSRLEGNIEYLERTLIFAKELRNTSAPILTLPDEVLLQICTALRDSYNPKVMNTSGDYLLGPAWTICSTICRRFRRVAHNSPTLYTRLDARILPWMLMEQGMTLSRSLDLNVDIPDLQRSYEANAVLFALKQHGHRISDFFFETSDSSYTSRMMPRILDRIPNVKALAISWAERTTTHGPALLIDFGSAPPPFLSQLTRLSLSYIAIRFSLSVMANLTEVRLERVLLNGGGPRSCLETYLGCMTGLQKLVFEDVIMRPPFALTSVDLPNSLRYLEYITPMSFDILRRLTPSPSVRVKLVQTTTPADSRSEDNELALSQILDSWLGTEGRTATVSLAIRYTTSALEARVGYWNAFDSRAKGLAPDFELVRYIDEDFNIDHLFLGSIYDHVTEISFDVDWDYPLFRSESGWLHSVGPLLKLRTLLFTGPRMSRSVHFHLMKWPSNDVALLWQPAQLFAEDREPMGDVRVLLDWLTERHARGLKLSELTLPAHVGVALDEMVVKTGSGMDEWRSLVSDVHIDYRV